MIFINENPVRYFVDYQITFINNQKKNWMIMKRI